MKGRKVAWAAGASPTLIAAGSLGFGVASASDSNNTGGGGDSVDAPRGVVAPASVMGAVVKGDGTLNRSTTAGITSDGFGRGSYGVIFPIDVTACTFVATIGRVDFSGIAPPGFITTVGLSGDPNGVFVKTHQPDQGACEQAVPSNGVLSRLR